MKITQRLILINVLLTRSSKIKVTVEVSLKFSIKNELIQAIRWFTLALDRGIWKLWGEIFAQQWDDAS